MAGRALKHGVLWSCGVHVALLSLHLLLQSLGKLCLSLPLHLLGDFGINSEAGCYQPAATCRGKLAIGVLLLKPPCCVLGVQVASGPAISGLRAGSNLRWAGLSLQRR